MVKAAYYGWCSAESAMLELCRRMDEATVTEESNRIKVAIDVLKARGDARR